MAGPQTQHTKGALRSYGFPYYSRASLSARYRGIIRLFFREEPLECYYMDCCPAIMAKPLIGHQRHISENRSRLRRGMEFLMRHWFHLVSRGWHYYKSLILSQQPIFQAPFDTSKPGTTLLAVLSFLVCDNTNLFFSKVIGVGWTLRFVSHNRRKSLAP